MADPIVSGPELAAHLGGQPDAGLCDLIAQAVSEMVAAVVDAPVDPDPWPASTRTVGLMAAADTYKAATGTGGGYQLDATSYTDVYRLSSTILRRYEPVLAAQRAVGGMIG
jgi:hypothetical protein